MQSFDFSNPFFYSKNKRPDLNLMFTFPPLIGWIFWYNWTMIGKWGWIWLRIGWNEPPSQMIAIWLWSNDELFFIFNEMFCTHFLNAILCVWQPSAMSQNSMFSISAEVHIMNWNIAKWRNWINSWQKKNKIQYLSFFCVKFKRKTAWKCFKFDQF